MKSVKVKVEVEVEKANGAFLRHHDHAIEIILFPVEEDDRHVAHECNFRILVSKCVNCQAVIGTAMVSKEALEKILY